MLSERDLRTLRDIEQQPAAEDRQFAAVMSRPMTDRTYRRARLCHDIVIVLALVLAVVCFALYANHTLDAAIASTLLAATTISLRSRRFPYRQRGGSVR